MRRRILVLNLALLMILSLLPFGALAADLQPGIPASYTKDASHPHETMTFMPSETGVYKLALTDDAGAPVSYTVYPVTWTSLYLHKESDDGLSRDLFPETMLMLAGQSYSFWLEEIEGSDVKPYFDGTYSYLLTKVNVPQLELNEEKLVNNNWASFTAQEDGWYAVSADKTIEVITTDPAMNAARTDCFELFAGDTCYVHAPAGGTKVTVKAAEVSEPAEPVEPSGDYPTYPGTRIGVIEALYDLSGSDDSEYDSSSLPFTDLDGLTDHQKAAVVWAVDSYITTGVSEKDFAPDSLVTRGQFFTFLWRTCGSPEPASTVNPFRDVPSDAYYYKAVLWAVHEGMIQPGVNCESEDTFGPNGGFNRIEVLDAGALLFRLTAKSPAPCAEHTWVNGTGRDATCGQSGGILYTCAVCGATHFEKKQAPLGHKWGDYEIVTAPTCEEPGLQKRVCARNNSHVEYEKIQPLGHDWGSWTVLRPATETEEGLSVRVCKRDNEHTEYMTIPKTESKPVEPTKEDPKPDDTKPTPKPVKNPFTDVKKGDYFFDPVLWALNHDPQITDGTTDTTFSPADTCTRGQVVTFLWRAMGCEEPANKTNPFSDVKDSDYFYKAVLWAVEKGITDGTSDTTFSPADPCTRAHVVTFLWRAENKPDAGSKNPFGDVASGNYYTDAVLWAVSKQITDGTSDTTFSPADPCTRGQIVTFLYRDMK